jgi:quinol-cytochrome oxidoreductase complex cytochrome b subunit
MSVQSNRSPTVTKARFANAFQWIDHRLPVFTFVRHELSEYRTPTNLNYLWNFGSIAGVVLVIMIVTGVALAMHYVPTRGGRAHNARC